MRTGMSVAAKVVGDRARQRTAVDEGQVWMADWRADAVDNPPGGRGFTVARADEEQLRREAQPLGGERVRLHVAAVPARDLGVHAADQNQ